MICLQLLPCQCYYYFTRRYRLPYSFTISYLETDTKVDKSCYNFENAYWTLALIVKKEQRVFTKCLVFPDLLMDDPYIDILGFGHDMVSYIYTSVSL